MFDSLNVMRPRLANVHSEGIVVQFRKDNDFETVEFGAAGRILMVHHPKRHHRSIQEWEEQLYRHGLGPGIRPHKADFEGTVGFNNRVVLLMDPLTSMDERTASHLYHRTLLVHCYKSAYTHELDKSLRAYQFAPQATRRRMQSVYGMSYFQPGKHEPSFLKDDALDAASYADPELFRKHLIGQWEV